MRASGFRRPWTVLGVIGCALVAGTTALASVASAARAPAARQPAATGHVSPVPAEGTPSLATTGTVERVRQIVQCGGTMYAVGAFTAIEWDGKTYFRHNAFSFSATSPFRIKSWNPDVNGEVNSVALTPTCGLAWLGGTFTKVAGTSVSNIAEVSASTGAVVTSWPHSANDTVSTILYPGNGHLLVGGDFTSINGSGRNFYASLNPTTGRDDGYLNLTIAGHYVFPGSGFNNTRIYNQQLSPLRNHVLVEGVFTSVAGQSRQQIFMLNLGASHGTVSAWNSSEFSQHCADKHPFYIEAAAWSTDQSTVYIASTGFRPFDWNGSFPFTTLCDAAAAFPATQTGGLHHKWVNYTGCDSLYSAATDSSTVYVGGHQRWLDNSRGCNQAGPGAIPAPGLAGLTPGGSLLTNFSGTRGLYRRARGLGADDMLRTSAGLWIASDNFAGSNSCGGVSGHAGICFLPN
jgi:hypothetical protein